MRAALLSGIRRPDMCGVQRATHALNVPGLDLRERAEPEAVSFARRVRLVEVHVFMAARALGAPDRRDIGAGFAHLAATHIGGAVAQCGRPCSTGIALATNCQDPVRRVFTLDISVANGLGALEAHVGAIARPKPKLVAAPLVLKCDGK